MAPPFTACAGMAVSGPDEQRLLEGGTIERQWNKVNGNYGAHGPPRRISISAAQQKATRKHPITPVLFCPTRSAPRQPD